ncbi:hypothetical protein [Flavobacterium gelatinilyticum]|uniref:hypothetical protein n=1 Tax=Flavobacterium gelatinilyticum TaxID=3003260 RepID=UPI00248003F1|nr:hypothetical protein [Flavobacterium gelatinilyticum]
MKTTINYIFLLFTTFSFAQDKLELIQKDCFEKGQENLKTKNLKVAYNFFTSAYSFYPTNEIGKASLKKSDSISHILRKELFDKVKGKWKLTKYETKPNFDEVQITENKIEFKHLNQIVRTEKIVFKEDSRYFRYFFEFRFKDSSTWQIHMENESLKLWNSGGRDKDGLEYRYSCAGGEFLFERLE